VRRGKDCGERYLVAALSFGFEPDAASFDEDGLVSPPEGVDGDALDESLDDESLELESEDLSAFSDEESLFGLDDELLRLSVL
jgi:hypothetical protein